MKQIFSIVLALASSTVAWAQNSVITYSASEKLPETTTVSASGLHTNAFGNPTLKSHEYDAETHKGTITFSGDVNTLNRCAFYQCAGLTAVTLPESLKTIDVMAFSGCTSLTSITIPQNVTSIGSLAFNNTGMECPAVAEGNTTYKVDGNCLIHIADNKVIEGFKTSTIPSYIKSIGDNAFNNVEGLTNITIPEDVTSIGEAAFANNAALASVTVMATTPATFGNDVFKYCAEGLKIIVPAESVEAYKAAEGWSAYADKIEASPIATAITAPAAEKAQKAVKTVENGQIVIIRNGVKYDITGRKL